MQPLLVGVASGAGAFSSLFEAARAAGVRVGWLDLDSRDPQPSDLGGAATAGAMRSVGVAGRTTVAVKQLSGDPVLRDLVREHFTGCRLVLVRGKIEAPQLHPAAGDWRLQRTAVEEGELLSTEALLTALRSPCFPDRDA
ncbi:MAG: hypothetical protein OEM62_07240 [Acidobacteriota bacterium]|nr:hypothetical protein [Acidobacteriota bacterium]